MKSKVKKKLFRHDAAEEMQARRQINHYAKKATRTIEHYRKSFSKMDGELNEIFTQVQPLLTEREFGLFMKSVGMNFNDTAKCFELCMP
jgi:hypothetical protein